MVEASFSWEGFNLFKIWNTNVILISKGDHTKTYYYIEQHGRLTLSKWNNCVILMFKITPYFGVQSYPIHNYVQPSPQKHKQKN